MGKLKAFTGTLFMAVLVGVMLKLGFWQLERLEWKTGLIAQMKAQLAVDPWSNRLNMANFVDSEPGQPFTRGYVEGRFEGKSLPVGPYVVDGALGYWIVTPMRLRGATEGAVVLAVRGWVPDTLVKDIVGKPLPRRTVRAAGTARDVDARGPANNPAIGVWHRIDTKAMHERAANRIFFIEQTRPAGDKRLAAVPAAVNLRNEHRNYAVFWFSMGALFAALWVAVILRGRRSASSQGPLAP